MADVVIINKVDQAEEQAVEEIRDAVHRLNPTAAVLTGDLVIDVDKPESIKGRRVLVIEDGPTLTHGGMSFGAGSVAACQYHAAEQIDPRSSAVGSIAEIYERFPHLGAVLPALGYSEQQREELRETIDRCQPEMILDASPASLTRWLDPAIPVARVRYRFEQRSGEPLEDMVTNAVRQHLNQTGG